jgi:predicted permease
MSRFDRLLIWLYERSLAPDERDAVIGDVLEELDRRAARDPRAARLWLWADAMRSLPANLRRRVTRRRTITVETQIRSGVRMLTGLATDVRFALRLLRRQPLTSLIAFASLAAALGLNVLLVTLADAAMFRALPVRDPASLHLLLLQRETGLMHNLSYPDYTDLRDRSRTVDGLIAYSPVQAILTGGGESVPLDGEVVSGNFFAALGVPLLSGRPLTPGDDAREAPATVVVSQGMWRDRFGEAPLSGQTLTLNGRAFVIVGITDRAFAGMQIGRQSDFWVALAHSPVLTGDDFLPRATTSWLTVMGRLRPGVGQASARDELDAILRRVRETSGRPVEPVVLRPGARGDSTLSEQVGSPLTLLLMAGGVVLLIACLNVANLQLAKADARRRELAVRLAIGARRSQIVRLLAIDACVLAGAAGIAGVGLAALATERAASLIAFYGQPIALSIPFDRRLFGAALGLSASAALVIGLLSTWWVLRRNGMTAPTAERGAQGRRPLGQRVLVVAQIALSMGLLASAALLVRTLDRLRQTDLGFDPRGLVVLQASPEMARLSRTAATAYLEESRRAVMSVPGVQSAAVAHVMPLDFGGSRTSIEVAGYTPAANEDMEINFVRISPDYFQTIGLPLREGRAFDNRDRDDQPQRIVVNETMARRFWPGGRATGRFVRFGPQDPFNVEVVGVVADAHYRMVREDPMATLYVPLTQWPYDSGVLHVRVAASGPVPMGELRRAVAAVNPAVPITKAHTLADQIERNVADERMSMAIGVTLALVALLLASAGLYATMAFLVGRRTREIGVRMALGARTSDVRALVLTEGLMLALAGVAGGLAFAAWAGHALRHQLYGVGALDGASLAAAAIVLAGAALLASWLPARRAAKVDPVIALRDS